MRNGRFARFEHLRIFANTAVNVSNEGFFACSDYERFVCHFLGTTCQWNNNEKEKKKKLLLNKVYENLFKLLWEIIFISLMSFMYEELR